MRPGPRKWTNVRWRGPRSRVDFGARLPPPLQDRLGLRERGHVVAEDRADRAVMARSLMYLFAAGGAVSLGSIALTTATDDWRVAITGACAFGMAALLLVAYDRTPIWGFQVLLAVATGLVGWSIYASGDTTSPYVTFYFRIAISSFYFLTRSSASAQLAFLWLADSAFR